MNMTRPSNEYFSVNEAAEYLNKSIDTIQGLIYSKASAFKLEVTKVNKRIWIHKNDLDKYKAYLFERDGVIDINPEYAMEKLSKETNKFMAFIETRMLFLDYSRRYFNKMTGSNSYKKSSIAQFINFHNKLQQHLAKEIFDTNEQELMRLLEQDSLFGAKEKILFTRFVAFAFNIKGIKKKNILLANPKSNRSFLKEVYSPEVFNAIYNHVTNIELHLEKGSRNRKYTNMWLYVTLLCCDFIRGSDLVLNTPTINLNDIGIKKNTFFLDNLNLNDQQIQSVIKEMYLHFRNKRASKTGEILTFLVPSNLEKPLAYSLVLSELLRGNDKIQLGTFIEGKYRRVRTHGGDLHLSFFNSYKEFEGFKFSSLLMNRSVATYLYGTITEGDAYDSELALTLTKNARSHRNEDSTKAYIQMMNKDSCLNRVANNIFRRGHFGWLYDQLLKYAFDQNYNSLRLEERTLLVEQIKSDFSLQDSEAIASFIGTFVKTETELFTSYSDTKNILEREYEKKIKVIHKIMNFEKQQIQELLEKIANQTMPSKNEYAQCLAFPNCKYPSLKNCLYCEYVLPQNLILIQLNSEILRLLHTIDNTTNNFMLIKQSHFLLQSLFVLSEANKAFGKDYVKGFVDTNKINQLLIKISQKIDL